MAMAQYVTEFGFLLTERHAMHTEVMTLNKDTYFLLFGYGVTTLTPSHRIRNTKCLTA